MALVRICRYDTDGDNGVSKTKIFNNLDEAKEFIETAEDEVHFCTLDYIQHASERKWNFSK